jgi:hypothetical protein
MMAGGVLQPDQRDLGSRFWLCNPKALDYCPPNLNGHCPVRLKKGPDH